MTTATTATTSIIDLAIERHAAEAERKRQQQERANWRHFCGNLRTFFGHGSYDLPERDEDLCAWLVRTDTPIPRPYELDVDYLDATLMFASQIANHIYVAIDGKIITTHNGECFPFQTLIELGAYFLNRREDSEHDR